MSADISARFGSYLPNVLLLIGLACLGYGVYQWATIPSSQVISRAQFDPFPEFLENATYQISLTFENVTNRPMRVLGFQGC